MLNNTLPVMILSKHFVGFSVLSISPDHHEIQLKRSCYMSDMLRALYRGAIQNGGCLKNHHWLRVCLKEYAFFHQQLRVRSKRAECPTTVARK